MQTRPPRRSLTALPADSERAEEMGRRARERVRDRYAKWHLGVDDEHRTETKGHYKFPCGDFEAVHRCGVLAAESRAGQRKYADVEQAAAHLHGMLEALAPR